MLPYTTSYGVPATVLGALGLLLLCGFPLSLGPFVLSVLTLLDAVKLPGCHSRPVTRRPHDSSAFGRAARPVTPDYPLSVPVLGRCVRICPVPSSHPHSALALSEHSSQPSGFTPSVGNSGRLACVVLLLSDGQPCCAADGICDKGAGSGRSIATRNLPGVPAGGLPEPTEPGTATNGPLWPLRGVGSHSSVELSPLWRTHNLRAPAP